MQRLRQFRTGLYFIAMGSCVSSLLLLTSSCRTPHSVENANACINNIRHMDAAKQMWALENRIKTNAVPTWDDVREYLHLPAEEVLHCPQGGFYTLEPLDQWPRCSIPRHNIYTNYP